MAPCSIVVDAARGTGGAGAIHRIDLQRDVLPPALRVASTHAVGLADAIRLARTLGLLPACAVLYAIEGGYFGLGHPVSRIVRVAGQTVIARVRADIARWRSDGLTGFTDAGCTISRPPDLAIDAGR